MTGAPLLELRGARIDGDAGPLIESVSFQSSGDRLGLLGKGRAIFDACAGTARLVAGDILVQGVPLAEARRTGQLAVAAPWPAPGVKRYGLSILQGLTCSAMLAGASSAEAKRRAGLALEQVGLSHLADQHLGAPLGLLHYLAGLAEAALLEPSVLFVDWPIAQLTAEAWARYGTALAKLLERRPFVAWVSGTPELAVERSWLLALDELVLLDSHFSAVVPTGGEKRLCTLVVIGGNAADVAPYLLDLGLPATPVGERLVQGSATTAYLVDLPQDEWGRPCTEAVFTWSDRHQLPLLRLEPLAGVC